MGIHSESLAEESLKAGAMRGYITHMKVRINTIKREVIMKIKERIKTIIDDYSTANEEARERNKIKSFFKGPSEAAESPWTYVKDPILLKVKGHLATFHSLIDRIRR